MFAWKMQNSLANRNHETFNAKNKTVILSRQSWILILDSSHQQLMKLISG